MNAVKITSPEQWHELRAKNIGSSDVAALFGLSPYKTLFELWHEKRGSLPSGIKDSERMAWGRDLEAVIAKRTANQEQWLVSKPAGYYPHATIAGMGCTPDFMIESGDNRQGILECKNVDWIQWKQKWTGDEPPMDYLLQLQHQLACTGCAWGAIAALVGGNELHVHRYERNEPTIKLIEQKVAEFWQSVEADKEPAVTSDDYDALRVLYKNASGEEIDLTGDNQMPELCAVALIAAEERKEAEKKESAAKAAILQKIGSAALARCDGFVIKAPTQQRGGYEVKPTSFRTMTIKEMTA